MAAITPSFTKELQQECLNLGQQYLKTKNYSKAIEVLTEGLEKFQPESDLEKKPFFYQQLAFAYFKNGNNPFSRQNCDLGLKCTFLKPETQAKLLLILAQLNTRSQQFQETLNVVKSARECTEDPALLRQCTNVEIYASKMLDSDQNRLRAEQFLNKAKKQIQNNKLIDAYTNLQRAKDLTPTDDSILQRCQELIDRIRMPPPPSPTSLRSHSIFSQPQFTKVMKLELQDDYPEK